jgi:hypothetical protein
VIAAATPRSPAKVCGGHEGTRTALEGIGNGWPGLLRRIERSID